MCDARVLADVYVRGLVILRQVLLLSLLLLLYKLLYLLQSYLQSLSLPLPLLLIILPLQLPLSTLPSLLLIPPYHPMMLVLSK